MGEEAKVAVRNIRRDANHELTALQKDHEITEDDLRRGEADVQKMTDDVAAQIDERIKRKEAEILEV